MLKLIKYLIYLAILTGVGIVFYALFFELPAPTGQVERSIELNVE